MLLKLKPSADTLKCFYSIEKAEHAVDNTSFIIIYVASLLLLFLLLSLPLSSVNCVLRFANKNVLMSFS